MPAIPLLIVDAFAARPFAGNPAAVCLLDAERDAAWMQSVAAEMNLSETAFVRRVEEGNELRWFTPKVEVALCGHATLAAAHTLWTTGAAPLGEPIRFHTASGTLTATRTGDLIELDFPATPTSPCTLQPDLLAALFVGWDEVPPLRFTGQSRFDAFLLLPDAAAIRALRPDFRRLREVDVRGVTVTAASDDPCYDFISRFFAPAVGIDEDPVTGSAHCALGPFWSERLGKPRVVGYQASPRGGVVHVEPRGDRVTLGGQAHTVLRGELA